MQPMENAFVPHGANNRPFAVVKEFEMKLDVTGVLKALNELLPLAPLLKGGKLDAAGEKQVVEKIGGCIDLLIKAGALEDVTQQDATLKTSLADLCGKIDQLAKSTQDLNIADQISALKDDVNKLMPAEDSPASETAAGAPATVPAATPAATSAATASAATPATAAPATKTGEPAAVPTGAAAAAEPEATPAVSEDGEPDPDADPEGELVSKSDFTAFMTQVNEQLKAIQVSVAKAAAAPIPATRPVETQVAVGENPDDYLGGFCFGTKAQLAKIKLPNESE